MATKSQEELFKDRLDAELVALEIPLEYGVLPGSAVDTRCVYNSSTGGNDLYVAVLDASYNNVENANAIMAETSQYGVTRVIITVV